MPWPLPGAAVLWTRASILGGCTAVATTERAGRDPACKDQAYPEPRWPMEVGPPIPEGNIRMSVASAHSQSRTPDDAGIAVAADQRDPSRAAASGISGAVGRPEQQPREASSAWSASCGGLEGPPALSETATAGNARYYTSPARCRAASRALRSVQAPSPLFGKEA